MSRQTKNAAQKTFVHHLLHDRVIGNEDRDHYDTPKEADDYGNFRVRNYRIQRHRQTFQQQPRKENLSFSDFLYQTGHEERAEHSAQTKHSELKAEYAIGALQKVSNEERRQRQPQSHTQKTHKENDDDVSH